MPIYEYRCNACNDEFEVTQKISDEPLRTCPKCNGPVEKLISHSSFVLKGSGWYLTDYARKNGGKKSGEGKSGTACAASGSNSACASCPSSGD